MVLVEWSMEVKENEQNIAQHLGQSSVPESSPIDVRHQGIVIFAVCIPVRAHWPDKSNVQVEGPRFGQSRWPKWRLCMAINLCYVEITKVFLLNVPSFIWTITFAIARVALRRSSGLAPPLGQHDPPACQADGSWAGGHSREDPGI